MVARKKTSPARKKGQSEEEALLQRVSANRRERQRTKELNDAFTMLRRIIPSMPSDKMSKIHTLKIATEYIRFLDQMNSDGYKLFGCDISLYEENGVNLQTSFSLWRGGMAQPTVNVFSETPYYPSSSIRPINGDADGWFLTGKSEHNSDASSSSSNIVGYLSSSTADYGALIASGLVLDQSLNPSASSTLHPRRP
uniref:BHLH domain-containing protein n=1 Tax=Acrobeloides nanus TaxID=290746 RepID=A0A914CA28_9BILA